MIHKLSEHAAKRLRQRGIRVEWLEAALEHPARIEIDPEDPDLLHALRPIAERGFRVLRVIYNETRDPAVVVTAYFDDTVKDL
ncbi:MAG: DUF4258 domain-containing protein [Comamonadaceae bacterium]|jgi:hypothetical protein|nr:DUF4258 domain-containing protein [Comamonadaceae bacterium]